MLQRAAEAATPFHEEYTRQRCGHSWPTPISLSGTRAPRHTPKTLRSVASIALTRPLPSSRRYESHRRAAETTGHRGLAPIAETE